MYAYPFSGYWKDVGTISSLWEANMDLLGKDPKFNLYDKNRRIFFRTPARPSQYVGNDAVIKNSIITEGCEVYGTVINSVLFSGVYVAPGAVVKDSVVMSDTVIGEDARINYSIIDKSVSIGRGATVGQPIEEGAGITVLGTGVSVADDKRIGGGLMLNAAQLAALN